MADFAAWGEACAPVLGWGPGEFLRLLKEMRRESDCQALAGWVVTPVLFRMTAKGDFEGTVTRALERLNESRNAMGLSATSGWPSSPKGLSTQLRRYAPNLRRFGVTINWPGHGHAGNKVRVTYAKPEGCDPVAMFEDTESCHSRPPQPQP
jgi:hypothetical protein